MIESQGLARAREICADRGKRVRELQAAGRKAIGHYCCYVPREILTAAGITAFRITGDIKESITRADAYLETIMCPFIRSTVDLAFKGRLDFLNGLVVPHSCDSVERMFTFWNYYFKPGFSHYLNVPHMTFPSSYRFFQNEIKHFSQRVEEFAGKPISDSDLREAIALHNENRWLTRQLYGLRKQDPPLLTGGEALSAVMAGMLIPVEEHNLLLRRVIAEVLERHCRPGEKDARVLIYASQIDHSAFIDLVEESGGNVVMDDMCIGTRAFWNDVELTEDPYEGLAGAYLGKVRCPRTFRPDEGMERRFQYLLEYAREFNVNSVILYVTRFCDTHEFDVPDIKDFLQSHGYPVLHIEEDYGVTTIGQLKTRVQAFLEMVI